VHEANAARPGQSAEELLAAFSGLLEGERNFLANLANLSALIHHSLPELNWSGFYLPDGDGLVLGPFQGKPACTRIPAGRGVCGAAAANRETVVVGDVHAFPGHIACDPNSRSEIVVPLLVDGRLLGVLDLDSPRPGRFGATERALLESLVARLLAGSDLPG